MFILMQTGASGGMSMLLMMVIIFAIMWLFMIRPQQKRQKEIQNFRNAITVGTNVVTAGGIYGVVKSIDEADNALMVEVANGVRIKVDRNSVYASPNQQMEQKMEYCYHYDEQGRLSDKEMLSWDETKKSWTKSCMVSRRNSPLSRKSAQRTLRSAWTTCPLTHFPWTKRQVLSKSLRQRNTAYGLSRARSFCTLRT